MMPKNPEAVIFDIGEVLIRLDFSILMKAMDLPETLEISDALRRMDAWEIYDEFERGKISEENFFKAKPPLELIWNSVLKEAVTGLENILKEAKRTTRIFALTNTNVTHLKHASLHYPFMKSFEKVFSSCDLGCRKPESEIYLAVAKELQLSPSSLLFIDDRFENVEGARLAGWNAEHCKVSPQDLIQILKNYNVLPQHFS